MHALIIPSWYKTQEQPLAGTFVEDQARALQDNNVEVGILFPNWSGSFLAGIKAQKRIDIYDDRGLHTFQLNLHNIVPKWDALNYLTACKRAVNIFKIYCSQYGRPDILHAHSVFIGGIVAQYLSEKSNIPLVITEHSSEIILSPGSKNKQGIVEGVYGHSKCLILVSDFQRTQLKNHYNLTDVNTIVIPNTLNHVFEAKSDSSSLSESEFSFIAIGALNPSKNIGLAVEAINILRSRNLNVRLKIIGDGEERNQLKKLINDLKLDQYVKLLGSQTRAEVRREICSSHALVSTSKFETFGVSIIEALACGKPVIATNSGGVSEIVSDSEGILVKSWSPEDLSSSMEKLLKNYSNYIPEEIAANCLRRYSNAKISSKILAMYSDALER